MKNLNLSKLNPYLLFIIFTLTGLMSYSESSNFRLTKKEVGLGLSLWQENLSGADADKPYDFKGVFYTSQFSYQQTWTQNEFILKSEGSFLVGQMNINQKKNPNSSGFSYYKRGASLFGVEGSIGWLYSLSQNHKNPIGVDLMFIYRIGDFSSQDAKIGFTEKERLVLGIGPEFTWNFNESLSLTQKFIASPQLRDLLWQINFYCNL